MYGLVPVISGEDIATSLGAIKGAVLLSQTLSRLLATTLKSTEDIAISLGTVKGSATFLDSVEGCWLLPWTVLT